MSAASRSLAREDWGAAGVTRWLICLSALRLESPPTSVYRREAADHSIGAGPGQMACRAQAHTRGGVLESVGCPPL